MSNLERFGKYILLEKIAAGGMAEVYLAKSNGANGVSKFVAIKRILPQFSDNQDFIEMFKDEANVAINLNHSNVVSIYDFGIEKGQFFLVMEFVDGRNLRQILNELKKFNKSISIEQSVYIVKEAAAGLDHAHRCTDSKSGKPLNITHRDMSPQNIMISFEGDSKVIDFGIAKAEKESEGTKVGMLKGKFAYMSPEQSEGLPIDPRTDVFALGIILWELLANDRLFTGSNEAAILRKVRDCQIPPIRKINPLVPPELDRILTKALAKDKNVRYQTAANLQKDLNRFLNMQYPDFSSQDFSLFIKDAFKTAYAEAREKLVLYGKLETENSSQTEQKSQTDSETQSLLDQINSVLNHDKIQHQDLPPVPASASEPAVPKGMSSEKAAKISLDGLLKAGLQKNSEKPLPQEARPATHTSLYTSSKVQPKTELTQVTRMTHVTQMSKTNTYLKKNSQKQSASPDFFMKFLIIFTLSFISFWGYKTFLKPKSKNYLTETKKIKSSEDIPQGETVSASVAKVTISMSSQPSGARIYIDGKDTGYNTPAIVAVIANKDISVSMIKDGFTKYETTKQFNQTSSFLATLQPQISGGFINIYVVNGGAKPAIFINGQRLTEELPIKKYRIPANVEVTISAENAITRLNDEVKLKVAADQVTDVELILGRKQNTEKK